MVSPFLTHGGNPPYPVPRVETQHTLVHVLAKGVALHGHLNFFF
jgi:hypothetical protein